MLSVPSKNDMETYHSMHNRYIELITLTSLGVNLAELDKIKDQYSQFHPDSPQNQGTSFLTNILSPDFICQKISKNQPDKHIPLLTQQILHHHHITDINPKFRQTVTIRRLLNQPFL